MPILPAHSAVRAFAWMIPGALQGAFAEGIANRNIPTIIDIIVTRDPSKMLPGVDSRTAPVKKGDRPA